MNTDPSTQLEAQAYANFIARVADTSRTEVELAFYLGWVALAMNRYPDAPSRPVPPSPTQGESS